MKTMTVLFLVVTSAPAFADHPPGPPGPPGPPRRPPAEAFAACTGHAEGDACTVTFGEHTIDGQCMKVPEHIKEEAGKLFCRPHHRPPPSRP